MRRPRQGGRVHQQTEEVRLLEYDRRRLLTRLVASADLDPATFAERPQHLDVLGMEVARDENLAAPGLDVRHHGRFRDGGRAVVQGGVGHVHAGQLSDQCLVLEDRLQRPLARFRLIGRVRGVELWLGRHGGDRRGDEAPIHPAAAKGQAVGVDAIAARERRNLGHGLELGEPVGQLK